jgi:hypothetical protein
VPRHHHVEGSRRERQPSGIRLHQADPYPVVVRLGSRLPQHVGGQVGSAHRMTGGRHQHRQTPGATAHIQYRRARRRQQRQQQLRPRAPDLDVPQSVIGLLVEVLRLPVPQRTRSLSHTTQLA